MALQRIQPLRVFGDPFCVTKSQKKDHIQATSDFLYCTYILNDEQEVCRETYYIGGAPIGAPAGAPIGAPP